VLAKIQKIWADLSENMLKSGYFITILHKNFGQLSTAPPGKHQSRSPTKIIAYQRLSFI
jgi:hypothetical protein